VVCVLDYDAVHDVLDPSAHTLASRALVNLASGTPRQAREAADWASAHRADYLDGGIMAVPSMIGLATQKPRADSGARGFPGFAPAVGIDGRLLLCGK
jgi:3-hydroxyisobutyrate dehydrogenase-like beta-hydroxyacid dehydrogenase